ncbi:hypothetical protein ACFSC4_17855 [Deinococcus malanensis]|uniref:hypothetical protein n=1 Tax=Deinococcus malanensis TaxID=1706855 RepID=UPI003635F90C
MLGDPRPAADHPTEDDPATAEAPAAVETIVIAASPPASTLAASTLAADPAGRESPQERRRRKTRPGGPRPFRTPKPVRGAKPSVCAPRPRSSAPRCRSRSGLALQKARLLTTPTSPTGPQRLATAPPAARLQMRTVERLPASLRRATEPVVPEAPEPEAQTRHEPQDFLQPAEPGRLPGRRLKSEPIRIGWDEDESWRVVREPQPEPAMTRPSLPRWLLALMAALLLIVAGVWIARVMAGRTASAKTGTEQTASTAASCCEVRFVVQGAAGRGAELFVLDAPDGANLTPGQDLGRAPGVVRFPMRGRYRLRVVADGYSPATLNLTVPRASAVNIALGQ